MLAKQHIKLPKLAGTPQTAAGAGACGQHSESKLNYPSLPSGAPPWLSEVLAALSISLGEVKMRHGGMRKVRGESYM